MLAYLPLYSHLMGLVHLTRQQLSKPVKQFPMLPSLTNCPAQCEANFRRLYD